MSTKTDRSVAAGVDQCKAIAGGLQRKGVALQIILTSPLLRAQQTAEGIVKAWTGNPPEIQVCDQLAPARNRASSRAC